MWAATAMRAPATAATRRWGETGALFEPAPALIAKSAVKRPMSAPVLVPGRFPVQSAPMPVTTMDTPLGRLGIVERDGATTRLAWGLDGSGPETPLLAEARRQLGAYFAGDLTRFDLPLRVEGTEFQRAVCEAMAAIPFGETRTYGALARVLGAPAQAVGQACGANPIPILIPCHRVLGAGSLGGFSAPGGVETKVWLLRHEGAAALLI